MAEDDVVNSEEVNPFDLPMNNDFFGELKDYKPEVVKDDNEFKPLKGSYNAIVKQLTHKTGTSQTTGNAFDFYSLNMQIVETISGDKGENRYIQKRYNNENDKLKALMNDLFTAGVEFDNSSREAFDLSLTNAIDKQIKIRAWTWSPDKSMSGELLAEEDRVALQMSKIVKDFSGKKAKASELPF